MLDGEDNQMGWLRKKGKQLGRGIKSIFAGVGKAFNKVFGGLFKKLGPIGSIALMFLLPGIGQMFTQGLSWLQGGFSSLAGGGTWGSAAATTAAGTAATATGVGTATTWRTVVGKMGETIFGQAGSIGGKFAPAGTTSTLTGGSAAAGGVQWTGKAIAERGLLGNIGAVQSTITGAISNGIKAIPGVGDAYQGFEDWLNTTRSELVGERGVSQRWKTQQADNIITDEFELADTQAAAYESGPGKIKTDALEKLRKHNVAQQNIRYVESPGAPFWRDDRTLIDDPLGTIDVTTGKPLQVSNIASADIGQQIMGEKDWKTFSTRYGVNPTGTYGEASLRAVGRSALGRGAGKFGTMIGGQIASSYISDALADPMSRPGIVVSGGETESPQGMYIQNLVDYQSQGYTGKGDLNSLYYAPFYDNTSIAYQTLFQQAYANDPYGIEQSLMRAGIGNR